MNHYLKIKITKKKSLPPLHPQGEKCLKVWLLLSTSQKMLETITVIGDGALV